MSDRNTQTGKRKEPIEKKVDKLDGQEAIVALEKAVRAISDKSPMYKELAGLYRGQHQAADALRAIRKAIKYLPSDIQARETLLEILIELGRFDEAIEEAKELLQFSPRNLNAKDALSVAYLQKGMLDNALQVTNELINMDPTSAANHFKKACLYQQKGDVGGAIQEFSRVLEMQPDSEIAQDARQSIEALDSYQLRYIVMLAVEDSIFRAKLARDPEAAALERGYCLSYSGLAALKQIQFDDLPEVYSDWKQKYYH